MDNKEEYEEHKEYIIIGDDQLVLLELHYFKCRGSPLLKKKRCRRSTWHKIKGSKAKKDECNIQKIHLD